MSTTTTVPASAPALDRAGTQSRAAPPPPLSPEVTPPPAAPQKSAGPPPQPGRKPRRIVTRGRVVVAAVVVALAAAAGRALRPVPTDVEAAPATVGAMRVTVDADAVTRVRAHFSIAAPVTGLVERISLAEGDSVRAGDVVAVVTASPADPTTRRIAEARLGVARAGRAGADARVVQARASLVQAERDAARARALAAAGALADRDAETAQLAVDTRRGDLEAARAQARLAAAELAQATATLDAVVGASGVATPVRAPAAGRVLRIPERSARVVAAGTPLMELGDPSSLEIVADVLSSDATALRAGQDVELRGWGGAPLRGRVRRLEPAARTRVSALGVEEQRLNVLIDLVDPPATLGDGYRLEASTTVWEGRDILTVPASALLHADDRWQLYRIEGGRVRRRDVRVGHVGGGAAEVLDGLRAGDSVVLFPSDALRDDVRVRAGKS